MEAEKYCKKIFAEKTFIPDEIAYYYGYILYKLNKPEQSKQWLEKYLSFPQKDSANTYTALLTLDSIACKLNGYIEVQDSCTQCNLYQYTYDCIACNATGYEICPVCKGKGVTKTMNLHTMGQALYATCKKCEGKKIIQCLSCKGEKKKRKPCTLCLDKKIITVKKKCP